MTKNEIISKYGIEEYNYRKNYNNVYEKKSYVKDGRIDLIENYERAKADNFKGWCIHHKFEIHDDYRNSRNELIMMKLYYDRPPEELIWLTIKDHMKLHNNKYNMKTSKRKTFATKFYENFGIHFCENEKLYHYHYNWYKRHGKVKWEEK